MTNLECFTADPKQVFAYDIFPDVNDDGELQYFLPTSGGDVLIRPRDWIATDDHGNYHCVHFTPTKEAKDDE